jgi:molybdate/tungstate transport system ATP-binding protein
MIEVRDLSIRLGAFALSGISFTIPQGHFGILMGRTGCGKTSIVEAICGLRPHSGGRIMLMGRDVTEARPGERGVGFVPQDGALFSTMTVREHLAFPLNIRGWGAAEIARRADELAALLRLTDLLERRPENLSGGERQRVSLGRALSFRPQVLCMDEPLSSLDEETRLEMYELLRSVQKQTGVTTLHVTHSKAEAEALGACCLVLSEGKILSNNPSTVI